MKINKFIQKFLQKKDIKKEILDTISKLDINNIEWIIIRPTEMIIKEVKE